MSIWKNEINSEALNSHSKNTLLDTLGIEVTEIGEDYIKATMPVLPKVHQPMGLLHGGASVALAESLGSMASMLCIENLGTRVPVGVEINANHLKSVRTGIVTGTCKPVRVGRNIHVWAINIHDEKDNLVCISRLTVAVVNNPQAK